jgi:hypothetical protein
MGVALQNAIRSRSRKEPHSECNLLKGHARPGFSGGNAAGNTASSHDRRPKPAWLSHQSPRALLKKIGLAPALFDLPPGIPHPPFRNRPTHSGIRIHLGIQIAFQNEAAVRYLF